jgi:uncharacterized protein (UPF0548 family)
MFLVRKPAGEDIERFIAASRDLPLSYEPVGLARHGGSGFRLDEEAWTIGSGEAAFERASAALREWRHFDLGWVELFPKRPPTAPGTVVAVLIRHLGFWSLNGCRVVYELGRPGDTAFGDSDVGFAYGTLPNHAEAGEEIFRVRLQPETGAVSYVIRALSRPRAALAMLGHPVVRSLQARFRRDSAAALTRAIAC